MLLWYFFFFFIQSFTDINMQCYHLILLHVLVLTETSMPYKLSYKLLLREKEEDKT